MQLHGFAEAGGVRGPVDPPGAKRRRGDRSRRVASSYRAARLGCEARERCRAVDRGGLARRFGVGCRTQPEGGATPSGLPATIDWVPTRGCAPGRSSGGARHSAAQALRTVTAIGHWITSFAAGRAAQSVLAGPLCPGCCPAAAGVTSAAELFRPRRPEGTVRVRAGGAARCDRGIGEGLPTAVSIAG